MKFYKCEICGNVIELIDGDASRIECCGQEMTELQANIVDASLEKHVPSFVINGDNVEVTVGEVIHPMEEKHYIMWIALVKDNEITRINLKSNEEPKAVFKYCEKSTIYAYCNIHGLWKKEI